MKVYTLMGGYDYEGEVLLGVFASKEDMLNFIQQEKSAPACRRRPETLGYDSLVYVASELGERVDFHSELEEL